MCGRPLQGAAFRAFWRFLASGSRSRLLSTWRKLQGGKYVGYVVQRRALVFWDLFHSLTDTDNDVARRGVREVCIVRLTNSIRAGQRRFVLEERSRRTKLDLFNHVLDLWPIQTHHAIFQPGFMA